MPEFNSTRGEDENAEAFEVDDEIHPDDGVRTAMFSRLPPQLPPPTTTLAPRKLAAGGRGRRARSSTRAPPQPRAPADLIEDHPQPVPRVPPPPPRAPILSVPPRRSRRRGAGARTTK